MGHGTDAQLLHCVCWGTDQQLNMDAVGLGPYLQESGSCTYFTSVSGQLTQRCQPASAESEMLNSSLKVQPLLGRLGIQIKKEKSLLGLSHSSKKAAFCWVGYWETLAVTVSPAEGKKGFAFCPSRMGLPSYTFLEVRKPSEAAAVSPPTRRNQGYSFCLILNPTVFLGEEEKATETGTEKAAEMKKQSCLEWNERLHLFCLEKLLQTEHVIKAFSKLAFTTFICIHSFIDVVLVSDVLPRLWIRFTGTSSSAC